MCRDNAKKELNTFAADLLRDVVDEVCALSGSHSSTEEDALWEKLTAICVSFKEGRILEE